MGLGSASNGSPTRGEGEIEGGVLVSMTILEQVRLAPPPALPITTLDRAIPVRVDNVARYLDDHKAAEYPVAELPNVAPPWPSAFYEFSVRAMTYGVLLRSQRMDNPVVCFTGEDESSEAQWVCHATFFLRDARSARQITVGDGIQFMLAPDGRFLHKGRNLNAIPVGMLAELKEEEPSTFLAVSKVFGFSVRVVFFANCFTHCKNVEVIDNPPPPKLSAAQEKRYGIPKLTYKTLNIVPMQQVLHLEGGMSKGNSLAKALHICRGHFADYREGAGLFGRYHGLVWRDMHVRGDKSAGVVQKDYAVNATDI